MHDSGKHNKRRAASISWPRRLTAIEKIWPSRPSQPVRACHWYQQHFHRYHFVWPLSRRVAHGPCDHYRGVSLMAHVTTIEACRSWPMWPLSRRVAHGPCDQQAISWEELVTCAVITAMLRPPPGLTIHVPSAPCCCCCCCISWACACRWLIAACCPWWSCRTPPAYACAASASTSLCTCTTRGPSGSCQFVDTSDRAGNVLYAKGLPLLLPSPPSLRSWLPRALFTESSANSVCVCVCARVCTVSVCVCMCVRMHICVHVCVYALCVCMRARMCAVAVAVASVASVASFLIGACIA